MAVFWLVILIGAAHTPLHVGNFPDLNACQNARNEMARGSGAGSGNRYRSRTICCVCLRQGEHWKSR